MEQKFWRWQSLQRGRGIRWNSSRNVATNLRPNRSHRSYLRPNSSIKAYVQPYMIETLRFSDLDGEQHHQENAATISFPEPQGRRRP